LVWFSHPIPLVFAFALIPQKRQEKPNAEENGHARKGHEEESASERERERKASGRKEGPARGKTPSGLLVKRAPAPW
jgi:hypothetical protein